VLTFAEYVLRGTLAGAVYALLAAPMTLLFATVRTMDFAIGAYALVAAAVAASIDGPQGLVIALCAAAACAGIMALIFVALKRFGCDDGIVYALASFGLATAIASVVLFSFGAKSFIRDSSAVFWSIGGIGASLAAVPVEAIQTGVYILGGLLGGLAGLLVLYSAGLDFSAPLGLTLSGFGAAILFGIGSPLRCLFGGIAMGIAQALASGYCSEAISAMTPFVFIMVVLSIGRSGPEALAGGRP
jgi:branched-chain amino acid transport system permease protein